MTSVGVLTGTATRPMLSPAADVILDDIGELPGWLGLEASRRIANRSSGSKGTATGVS